MYQVKVAVMFEDDSIETKTFNFWGDAAAWIQYLADENESLPKQITMDIIR